jgi:hypothetical protein
MQYTIPELYTPPKYSY